MRKVCFPLIVILVLAACSQQGNNKVSSTANKEFAIYSGSVKDSFFISVQLPEDYTKDSKTKYPVVYMLDANFHFSMLAPVVKQYEKTGMLPPLILVGIGYKSFELMDSLRNRDYLYPAALPSDEIKTVGGGKHFDEFITDQLIPYVDSNYYTDRTNRSLLGHSFGGYFTLYALLNQAENGRPGFKNFAAASPSLWYHNYYLDQLTDKLKNRTNKDSLNIFISVGGLEDSAWDILPVKKLANNILGAKINGIDLQYRIYNDLGHMDIPTITFIKALQGFYKMSD